MNLLRQTGEDSEELYLCEGIDQEGLGLDPEEFGCEEESEDDLEIEADGEMESEPEQKSDATYEKS